MAAPTAIPHHETSSHHQGSGSSSIATEGGQMNNMPLSRSPTGTSPRSMVSPIYTQAGRSAFSMPGPNSTSTSPTTTTWYSAGFASGNSQRVRSPTGPLNGNTTNGSTMGPISSQVAPQRDQFPDAKHPSHFRAASFGSASNASSLSSADLRDEPTTPKVENVTSMPLGRASSIPLGSSYERMKSRRDSWSFATAAGNRWSGLQSLRERTATVASGGVTMPTYNSNDYNSIPASAPPTQDNAGAGPMGGLLRKFSIGGGQPLKSPPTTSTPIVAAKAEPIAAATIAPPQDDYFKTVPQTRGRQNSAGSPNQRRRPSPMGERLLMGHFNAH